MTTTAALEIHHGRTWFQTAMSGHDDLARQSPRYLFDFRFLPLFFFLAVFFGTFCPAALASDRPIAMACLRLFTFRPERPLLKVPLLRFLIARPTLADAFFEYLRVMMFLPVTRN
jgi:hypothetical protein